MVIGASILTGMLVVAGVVTGTLIGTGVLFPQNSDAAPTTSPSIYPGMPTTTPTHLPMPTGIPSEAQIEAADPLAFPNLPFTSFDPGGGVGKTVAFTFDDGPGADDSTAHLYVLDQLAAANILGTFFINGNASVDVLAQPSAQAALRRTLAEGHAVGSHSYSHPDLTLLSPQDVVAQFDKNLEVFRDSLVFGANFTPTVYRDPFGRSVQGSTSDVVNIASLTAPYGTHVGWGIDTKDYECAENGEDVSCILDRFESFLQEGRSGPILMHSIYQLSGDALPPIFQMLYDYGYNIVPVEQMISEKYNVPDAKTLTRNWASNMFSPDAVAASAMQACRLNNNRGTAP